MFLVNLEQTSSCKFSIDHKLHSLHLWNFVSFANLLVLIYSNLKEKTHCQKKNYQIFLSINIITLFSANLSWWNITAEKKSGLASVFSITCAVCGTENVVKTSSEHRSSQRGPNSHDDNSRAALLCIHTGISETHLNNLLCTLNIPSMNPVTFKSRENEIGQAVKQVTKKSWQKQGKRGITHQLIKLQSWVWLKGRLCIILQEQNPAQFAQMLKKTGKEAKNTIFDSIIQHHQSNDVYSSSPFVYCSKT